MKKIMYGVIIAMSPAFLVSVFAFGLSALVVTAVAVAACIVFEYLIQKYILKVDITTNDGSAIVTGMLLAFNLPSNIPLWIILIGALVAIGVGKMSFGGLGNNPFNPALVGRVFLLISFPVQMTSWPVANLASMPLDALWSLSGYLNMDAVTGATPLAIIKEATANGVPVEHIMKDIPPYLALFFGRTGGSFGEVSGFALLLGFAYMLYKKIITWHIPIIVLGTIFTFAGILWLTDNSLYVNPMFHVLAGGAMLGAIFMATDMVTSPMTIKAIVIYAIGIGLITMLIRTWGAYPEGISFAILIMNGFVPLMNTYIKPKRFGEAKQNG